jgi:DNA invertase Pin-like site-specific DNA recombinase
MKIGYARVSTQDQNLDLQIDALKKSGCEKIYQEIISGAKSDRPVLNKMLEEIRSGDVIVIWKLDRLGRSLKHLIELTAELIKNNIGLQSINDPIDTTTPHGRLTFNIFASLAEFEKDIIKERTMAGLSAARARGRIGGRPKGLTPKAMNIAMAAEILYKEQKLTVKEICTRLNIAKATLYNYLKHRNVTISSYTKQSC